MKVVRSQTEIDDLVDRCSDQENKGGSIFPGMTYEQGIIAAVCWLEDKEETHPLDE